MPNNVVWTEECENACQVLKLSLIKGIKKCANLQRMKCSKFIIKHEQWILY